MDGRPAGLSPVELAGGMVLGFDQTVAPLPRSGLPAGTPRQALEEVLAEALARPPCVVSFSGGRDSSAMLALAVHVARREGLPPPIPVTLRIVGSAGAEESEWQDLTLDHLGIADRVRIDITDQLDVVGPIAAQVLDRHGLLWPFNTHFHVPMFEQATGGTVVTGFGGDEIGLSTATSHAERILAGRRLRRPSDVLVAGLALSPPPVRAVVHTRREARELAARPWLTPLGVKEVARAAGRAQAQVPLGWDRVLRRALWRARYVRVCLASFDTAAAPFGVRVCHPFVDRRVLSALAAAGGFAGLGDRTNLMSALFGDLLPAETVARASKATFDDAMWTTHARDFAAGWTGDGLPAGLVDAALLRRHWQQHRPHALSATLMQAAWLHDRSRA